MYKNKKLDNNQELVMDLHNPDEKYTVTFIPLDKVPDGERILYRIVSDKGERFYKGVYVTGTRMAEEANKNVSLEQIFDNGWDIVEKALLSRDKRSLDYVFGADGESIRGLDSDGGVVNK